MVSRGSLVLAALIGLAACSGSTPDTNATPAASPAPADDALSAVLAAYQRAAGGAAVARVQGLRATGIAYTDADRSNQRLVIQASTAGKFRLYESPVDGAGRQTVTLIGLDGAKGWRAGNTVLAGDGRSEDPAVRERAITRAARQNYINALSGMLPLLLRADGTITLALVPPVADGPDRGAPVIAITSADGPAGRLVFDPDTSLPAKFTAPYQTDIRAQGGEYTLTFSDFRAVDGVKVPFRITRSSDTGQKTHWSFRAYVMNPDFAAGTFTQPTR